jgi:hypothetical protein
MNRATNSLLSCSQSAAVPTLAELLQVRQLTTQLCLASVSHVLAGAVEVLHIKKPPAINMGCRSSSLPGFQHVQPNIYGDAITSNAPTVFGSAPGQPTIFRQDVRPTAINSLTAGRPVLSKEAPQLPSAPGPRTSVLPVQAISSAPASCPVPTHFALQGQGVTAGLLGTVGSLPDELQLAHASWQPWAAAGRLSPVTPHAETAAPFRGVRQASAPAPLERCTGAARSSCLRPYVLKIPACCNCD